MPPVSPSCTSARDAMLACEALEKIDRSRGLTVLGWRGVPPTTRHWVPARDAMPTFRQLFIGGSSGMDLERKAAVVRKRAQSTELGTRAPNQDGPDAASESHFRPFPGKTLVYKGVLTAPAQGLLSTCRTSGWKRTRCGALPVLHQHLPELAAGAPFRASPTTARDQHRPATMNWMRAREALLTAAPPGGDDRRSSRSAPRTLDTARIRRGARTAAPGWVAPPHARADDDPRKPGNGKYADMDPAAGCYRFHCTMEPWDEDRPRSPSPTGPVVGAVRTATACVRDVLGHRRRSGVLASEVGRSPTSPAWSNAVGSQPGRMFLVDTAQGRIIEDEEIKEELAAEHPYGPMAGWRSQTWPTSRPRAHHAAPPASVLLVSRQTGYTYEEPNPLVAPMARTGGTARDRWAPTRRSRSFRRAPDGLRLLPAVVRPGDEPPLTPSAKSWSLVRPPSARSNLLIRPANPVTRSLRTDPRNHEDLADLQHPNPMALPATGTGRSRCPRRPVAMATGLRRARRHPHRGRPAIAEGARILILSDQQSDDHGAHPVVADGLRGAPPPGPGRTRTQVGLVVESGDAARSTTGDADRLGAGRSTPTWPSSRSATWSTGVITTASTPNRRSNNHRKAAGKGVLKVMSKMASPRSRPTPVRQLFQAIGISQGWSTASPDWTSPWAVSASTISPPTSRRRHQRRPTSTGPTSARTATRGRRRYQWRREGEYHLFNPTRCSGCSTPPAPAVRGSSKEYTGLVDDQAERIATLRGLLKFRPGAAPARSDRGGRTGIEIVKRFSTGAMSYGRSRPRRTRRSRFDEPPRCAVEHRRGRRGR